MPTKPPNPSSTDHHRGVTPVIGVILMVAVTVILAATIAAYLVNAGAALGHTTPMAALEVQDAPDDYRPNHPEWQPLLTIVHNGGDPLPLADTELTIRLAHNHSTITRWRNGRFHHNHTGLRARLNHHRATTTDTLRPGDALLIQINTTIHGDPETPAVTDTTTYRVSLLDSSTNTIIAQVDIRIA